MPQPWQCASTRMSPVRIPRGQSIFPSVFSIGFQFQSLASQVWKHMKLGSEGIIFATVNHSFLMVLSSFCGRRIWVYIPRFMCIFTRE